MLARPALSSKMPTEPKIYKRRLSSLNMPSIPEINDSELEDMKKTTMEKAGKTISAIENALAVWDASKDKPTDLASRVDKLRSFHSNISEWEKKMLKTREKSRKLELLVQFTQICYAYQ